MNELIIPIEKRIQVIRGHRVLVDADLAELYGVSTKQFNQQIKRNRERFPEDFIFQLTQIEKEQVVTNCDHLKKLKYSPTLPYVFTEHGVVMAANLLNSKNAIEMSVHIVRIFIKMKQILMVSKKFTEKLNDLESRVNRHDESIKLLFQTLRQLIEPAIPEKRRKIGLK